MGSPQGDGLSPVLFAVYLEAAMRALLAHTKLTRPEVDAYIPHNTIIY